MAAAASPVQVDTLIGTVQLTGTDTIHLVPSAPTGELYGGPPLKLVGAPTLRSVNGLRVRVVGTQASTRWPDQVTVVHFRVIGTRSAPATDGTLSEDGGAYSITTDDGERHALTHVPAELRSHAGSRVWITGSLDREPIAFGVIE